MNWKLWVEAAGVALVGLAACALVMWIAQSGATPHNTFF